VHFGANLDGIMRSIKVVSSSQKAPQVRHASRIYGPRGKLLSRGFLPSQACLYLSSRNALPSNAHALCTPQVNHLYSPKMRRALRERAQSFRCLRPAMTEETRPEWHIQRLAVARRAMPVPSPAASRSLQIPNQRSAAGTVGLPGLPPRSRIIETKQEPLP
jgi:hypothetical protein